MSFGGFGFTLGDDAPSASEEWSLQSTVLRLEFSDLVVEEDQLEFELNGDVLPFDRFEAKFDVNDFKWLEYDLTRGRLPLKGANELVIRLKKRCPEIAYPLMLTRLEIFTGYR